MKRLLAPIFAAVMLLAVPACSTTNIPAAPSEVTEATTLDERLGIAVETAYTAAAKSAAVSIEAGLVTDPDTIARIGAADKRAYDAVLATRAAYEAGNADDYATAFARAQGAVTRLLAAINGTDEAETP